MVQAVFWISCGLIAYTYCMYPVLLYVALKMRGVRSAATEVAGDLPAVSLVVAAYNEESVLEAKIKNMMATEYPGKIEFLVGSDGSTDRTNEILQRAAGPNVRPFLYPVRRGKTSVLNALLGETNGDVVVFSDANTMYRADTVSHMVRHFQHEEVGGVCGQLVLQDDGASVGGRGESAYWNYENMLKNLESNYRTIVGATGGVYAIRKFLYKPLPTSRIVTDDFLIPANVVMQGFSVVYDPNALAYETTSNSVAGEFRRRVRISASNFNGISEFSHLLHPRNGFVAFSLWSHKIIRWCAPLIFAVILLMNIILARESSFFLILLGGQALLLALGVIGFIAEKAKIRIGKLGYPYYFIAMNAALLVGFVKFLLGRQRSTWEIVR